MCGRINNVKRRGRCQNKNYIWLQSQSRVSYCDYILDNTDHNQTHDLTLTDKIVKHDRIVTKAQISVAVWDGT